MRDYKSICKNCRFILSNLDCLDYDKILEFNHFINYFVDTVIMYKFDKKINEPIDKFM